jgi:hypothetical protein
MIEPSEIEKSAFSRRRTELIRDQRKGLARVG